MFINVCAHYVLHAQEAGRGQADLLPDHCWYFSALVWNETYQIAVIASDVILLPISFRFIFLFLILREKRTTEV